MGKLVSQDHNDEPASVLLEKIAEEKVQLVKEGKIKKQDLLPEISEQEKPHQCSHIFAYPGTNRAMSAHIRPNKDIPVIIAF
jgi:restriction endonuclease S subunit